MPKKKKAAGLQESKGEKTPLRAWASLAELRRGIKQRRRRRRVSLAKQSAFRKRHPKRYVPTGHDPAKVKQLKASLGKTYRLSLFVEKETHLIQGGLLTSKGVWELQSSARAAEPGPSTGFKTASGCTLT